MSILPRLLMLVHLTIPSLVTADESTPWSFALSFPKDVRSTPFSGRVTLFLSEQPAEPRLGPNWLQPEPLISLDVKDWAPDTPLALTPAAAGLMTFPRQLPVLTGKTWRLQAVARFNPEERQVGTGPGNGHSAVVEWTPGSSDLPVQLVIDQLIPQPVFQESEWSKLCEVPSPSLSAFRGRPVSVRAGVLLPASYVAEPARRYPVIFTIPGFGGSHLSAQAKLPVEESNPGGVEFIRVILDPSCPWGHHVFADSATNGPWGTALIKEWLPEFERRFRVAPQARFLTGHSSGGWSSLWLQITQPDVFHGVWSTAPDSVDFRDFQQANIYQESENAWHDPAGGRRPIARRGDTVLVWWDDFDRMEQVLGHGGQFQSFEAVFGPKTENGIPRPLWDRTTGAVDPQTAQAWRAWDIRRKLTDEWPTLGPKLAGKLNVFMGDEDTFYLNGATSLLKTTLSELGSDAVVEIQPGKDHRTLLSTELRDRIRREMAERFLALQ